MVVIIGDWYEWGRDWDARPEAVDEVQLLKSDEKIPEGNPRRKRQPAKALEKEKAFARMFPRI